MTMRLTREVRCFYPDNLRRVRGSNNWSGTVGPEIGKYIALRATVEGDIDPETGYLCNIKRIEAVMRESILPALDLSLESRPANMGSMLQQAMTANATSIGDGISLVALDLSLSPLLTIAVSTETPDMMQLTQSFEFSAAHRLYREHLSDEQNRRLFGKCANANGHGHNYVVDVTVTDAVACDGGTDRNSDGGNSDDGKDAAIIGIPELDRIVNERIIERFDHKHLNLDCPEFAELNPTVENIALVIYDLLDGRLSPARLHQVRVWETPKTFAEYSGR